MYPNMFKISAEGSWSRCFQMNCASQQRSGDYCSQPPASRGLTLVLQLLDLSGSCLSELRALLRHELYNPKD